MPYLELVDRRTALQYFQRRQTPVIVVPVFNSLLHLKKCLRSVVEHSPQSIDVLIIDDCSDDPEAVKEIIEQLALSELELSHFRKEHNEGYVHACNDAFEMAGRRDVILLNSDCIVGPEWYVRLAAAAESSSQIATVSTLTNHGTILSVPKRNQPLQHLPEGISVDHAAKRIAAFSRQMYPEIPVAVGHCLYVRRLALDLVGSFDPVFGKGYGDEVDLSLRCVQMGLRNVCADDVFVFHHGRGSFGSTASDIQQANEKIVNTRYPYYRHLLQATITDPCSDLAAALDNARISLMGVRVGIDARKLGPQSNGTQTVITQSLLALGNMASETPIVAYHLPHFDPESLGELGRHPNIAWESTDSVMPTEAEVDIIFRPCQVDTYDDLKWLHAIGRRVVVYQLDTIAYSNPSYFESGSEWANYQELTRLCLATADGVATVSQFSGSEMERKRLIPDTSRLKVVHHGALNSVSIKEPDEEAPLGFEDPKKPFLLCIGVSYHHKNRVFCLKLLRRLSELDWDGDLVFVGATPPHGSTSHLAIDEILPEKSLRNKVIDLETVLEPSKRWLYRHASLCLYPSVVEGFGLIPFESAQLGTPVLASQLASLGELLGEQALLGNFDVEQGSQTALHLMTCEPCRSRNIDLIKVKAEQLSWTEYAVSLNTFFLNVLRHPKNRLAMEIADRSHAWFTPATRDVERQRVFSSPIVFLRRHPFIKRIVSPENSRRQQVIRKTINQIRRRLL